MRKSIFFAVALVSFFVSLNADAAVAQRGNARGGSNVNPNTATQQSVATESASVPVSARAGRRQTVVSNGTKTSNNVSARAATRQNVKTGVNAARVGATQKVINTGTKVAAATENTAVPEECQNAFYGCMDAFCMLDNASGGRCQCNDRITELDAVLEDILRLDEQSYIMATEGVERIQMGEAEDVIMARAKAAGDAAAADNKSEQNKKKSRTLDLSIFNNSIFSEMDEDVFGAQSSILADKKGTALYNETARLCSAQIPQQCKSYNSMLALVYAQKIKSDCMAYENSLKAQKNQSQQKLQTAQKALREAALEEYKNQNKYATTGECVVAFTRCMQTTAECGDDYTGCVTLAARENMKNMNNGSTKAKQTRIKSVVSGADITLAASTMESLLAKKVICEKITKQCVNSNRNDAVWNTFLRNAAPALKSAELIAEQELRSNCIPTAAECFRNACRSQFGEDDESYDMCLSSPETYKSLCKVQLEPCLEATGGSFKDAEKSSLWQGLKALLGAMKVDTCTKEIKDCLTERCGKDYSECIGLDSETIVNICPYQKLTACMAQKNDDGTPYYADEKAIREYVAQIAQGLALQIDNSLNEACQNAANEAMIRVCGDTETCEDVSLDLSPLENGMSVKICDNGTTTNSNCYTSLATVDTDTLKNKNVRAVLIGAVDTSNITYQNGNSVNSIVTNKKNIVDASTMTVNNMSFEAMTLDGAPNSDDSTEDDKIRFVSRNNSLKNSQVNILTGIMNNSFDRIMAQINSDPKVIYCREGRTVQGFDGSKFGKKKGDKYKDKDGREQIASARFPNLTKEFESTVASALLAKLSTKNMELKSKFANQIAELDNQITELIYADNELGMDDSNRETCEKMSQNKEYENEIKPDERKGWCRETISYHKNLMYWISNYDSENNVCVLEQKKWECKDWICGVLCQCACREFFDATVVDTKKIPMAK